MANAAMADTICGLLAWLMAKRRSFYLSHLPASVQAHHKDRLSQGPVVSSPLLFPAEEVKVVAEEHQSSTSVRASQSLVELASGSGPSTSGSRKRARSPPGRARGTRGNKRGRHSSPAARSSSPAKGVGFSSKKSILRSPSKQKGFRK